ncbi:MAG: homogentisate 1,2-dioxygenase domain-containing protein [Steroidobacteraceae bacterium]
MNGSGCTRTNFPLGREPDSRSSPVSRPTKNLRQINLPKSTTQNFGIELSLTSRTHWQRATHAELKPHKIEDTMAFMFESRFAMRLTRYAVESSELQRDYFEGWQGLEKHFSRR